VGEAFDLALAAAVAAQPARINAAVTSQLARQR
jgi:hypothetical protein